MKIYRLIRTEDVTGISGSGYIADVVEFDNGKVVVSWRGDVTSIAVYDSLEMAERIHGHNGKTVFEEQILFNSTALIKDMQNLSIGYDDKETLIFPGEKSDRTFEYDEEKGYFVEVTNGE